MKIDENGKKWIKIDEIMIRLDGLFNLLNIE